MEVAVIEYNRSKIHPKKFALLLACVSIMMMFAGWTSAYIIRQTAGNWLEFELPQMFYFSTAVILLSSVLLQLSYVFFKRGNAALYRGLLVLSFVAGIVFILLQYQGWLAMDLNDVRIDGNPSGSFVYMLTGAHVAHVMGGLAAMTIALVYAFMLPMRVTSRRKLRFELTLIYWHFVDLLWLYLLFFLMVQQPG